ncbi:MAG: NAD(+) synthase [Prevotella sp.]|nr:NAD(+) synthase [Prevotella sp.]
MNNSFITIAAAIPSVKVADCDYNIEQIITQVTEAEEKGVEIIVFPELCVTGYTCQDLFRQATLLEHAELGIVRLLGHTRKMNIIAIVGIPVIVGDLLLNCAAVIQNGSILAMIPKTYLPNYNEFYEKRWFASSQDLRETQIRYAGKTINITPEPLLVRTVDNVLFGVEICEDVWAPTPPSNRLALSGADLIFNLSASDELVGKHDYLKGLLAQQSARTITGYIYSGSGYGESTQDVVYGGNALIYENGVLLNEADRFSLNPQMVVNQIDIERLRSERRTNSTYVNAQRGNNAIIVDALPVDIRTFTLLRTIDPHPFIPAQIDMQRSCEEIISIQSCGLAKRIAHTNSKNLIIGISGGLDSTLALLISVNTFDMLQLDRKGIIGVTMPGFGTTDRTYQNALTLMNNLGITVKEINIAKAVTQHFEDIGHDPQIHDVTYENSQARERTQILMDLTNQIGGFVVGTGDLSELALGWATYNGDHMSMYGVNASIPKTLIRYLVRYFAEYKVDDASKKVLLDIIDTPISPELIPGDEKGNINQKTEDLVGPYELHDFFLYYFLRFGFSPKKIYFLAQHAFKGMYDDTVIKKWLSTFIRRFFAQQFKRSCLPDGPKVGSVSLSPRGDWRMPSDAVSRMWIKECEEL